MNHFCLFVLLLVPVTQAHFIPAARVGLELINSFDIKEKEHTIQLPFTLRLFGDGKFSTVYVNSVGGVSFGGSIPSTRLGLIKSKAIVFSPLLLMPDVPAHIEIQYLFNSAETKNLQDKFRHRTKSVNFLMSNALAVLWNETDGNVYRIYFGSGVDERTYVLYDFENITRIIDSYGFASSGVFVLEDGSILCPVELNGSGTSEIQRANHFQLRVDLPLACDSFNYSCNVIDDTPDELQTNLMAQWQGYFFETLTAFDWMFYRLYMCISRLIKDDGTIAIKEKCEYDPDYYEYSWTKTTAADKCSRRNLSQE